MKPISLVCIAWNEEGGIERMLNSVDTIVNEKIVCIDKKTTDKTKEIAKRCGAKVFEFEWKFDFATHRNQAVALAENDWILILDGHEYIQDYGGIERALEDPDLSIAFIDVVMENETSHRSGRLYNRTRASWKNPVHNILVAKSGKITDIPKEFTLIFHDRTVQSMDQRIARSNLRNEHMLKVLPKRILENPLDTRSMFYLGQQYMDTLKWDASYYWHDRYCRTMGPNKWIEEEYLAAIRGALSAYHLRDYSNVERLSLYAIGLISTRAEAYFQLGQLYYDRKNYELALRYLLKADELPYKEGKLWVDMSKHKGGYALSDLISMVYWHLGRYAEAIRYADIVLENGSTPENFRLRVQKNKEIFRSKLQEK